jgi:hypothetical protein
VAACESPERKFRAREPTTRAPSGDYTLGPNPRQPSGTISISPPHGIGWNCRTHFSPPLALSGVGLLCN